MRLDEELSFAMRSRVAGERLDGAALVAAAERAHRRRRTARRGAVFAAGGLTLAAAVTGVVALSGTPTAVTPTAPPPAEVAVRPVSYVVARASDAIDRNKSKVTYVRTHTTANGETRDEEEWWDGATGDWRRHGDGVDAAITTDGTRDKFLVIDHTTRTWWAVTYPATDQQGSWSKQDVQAALQEKGKFVLVGEESLDGRATLHLRADPAKRDRTELDLWVDASTYDLVRTVSRLKPSGTPDVIVSTYDYTFVPRSAEELERFRLEPPADYRRDQSDAPQKSGVEPAK
ncbi:hypothetical protein [Cryptosporangium arvum]|uniref:Uncharacterized protein n=1 Tax=Cryptosporangium arvum DSM 44712 TaxID=927661 RepID=A0A010Z231_9ACTN|nr:hypothetical protein [Cryptosporangium arvum]EXG81483.1 hypothetical protein CryarDRAFT_2598 [Cryptosporangium arvum DSM 44712]